MSTWIDRAQAQLESHSTALKVIAGIGTLVKQTLVDPKSDAFAVLQAIERALDSLVAGFEGKISKEEVEAMVAKMLERRESRDERFDRILDEKFDKEPQ